MGSTMKKFIFLDIDGVLNSTRSAIALGGYGFFPGRNRMQGATDWVKEAKLDPIAVLLLERLVRNTDAAVVISSTWRIGSNVEEFQGLFKAYVPDNVFNIIGMTPTTNRCHRGEEIDLWLTENSQPSDTYVILDDDSDMLPEQRPFFVQTDYQIGLTHEHIEQAELILKGKTS